MRSLNKQNNKTVSFYKIAIIFFSTLFINSPAWSAVMNVTYDQFELNSSMIWESTVGNTTTVPDGTVDSDFLSGSVFGDTTTFSRVTSTSNMGFTSADIRELDGFNGTDVIIQSNYDDDCPGCLPNHGFAQASWNLQFNVEGSDGSFSLSGWWPTNTQSHINQVLLTDLTTGDANLFQSHSSIDLIDGHSYSLNALSQQSVWGLDGSTTMQLSFNDMTVNVPEPSTLLLMIIGLGLVRARKAK